MVEENQTAPGFTIKKAGNYPFEDFTLEDRIGDGPVVLAFFPGAFTEVCTEELCQFSDTLDEYEELDASVFGISVDSPFVLQEFKEQQDIDIQLLSDFNKTAIHQYDAVMDDMGGLEEVAMRSVFVIDEDGRIQYTWQSPDPTVLPEFADVRSAVEEVSD